MGEQSVDPDLNSPIQNLSHDIFWMIFLQNADMFNPRLECDIYVDELYPEYDFSKQKAQEASSALLTTLWSTHVCRGWREVILGPPRIWGQVLRVDRLYLMSREGREEVMRRTGAAPLYLMGEIPDSQDFIADFFVPLLRTNWERVQKLHLRVYDTDHLTGSFWNALLLDAPVLEHFALVYSGHFLTPYGEERRGKYLGVTSPAKCNTPVLQLLHVQRLMFKLRNLDSGKLSQLRSLKLCSSAAGATVILNAIAQMPLLESLDIRDVRRGIDLLASTVEFIRLPRLTKLTLSLSLRLTIEFAERIEPARHCILCLLPSGEFTDEDLVEIIPVVGRYLGNLLSLPAPLDVEIRASVEDFRFMVYDTEYPPTPMVDIDFVRCWDSNINTFQFLDPLSNYDLSTIHDLTLQISREAHASVINLINSMNNVEVLRINENDLGALTWYYKSTTAPFFPRLRALYLLEYPTARQIKHIYLEFSSHRESMDYNPVEVLDLGMGRDPLGDWRFLEYRAEGLKVVWMNHRAEFYEYTCGSGSPDRLRFGAGKDSDSDKDFGNMDYLDGYLDNNLDLVRNFRASSND